MVKKRVLQIHPGLQERRTRGVLEQIKPELSLGIKKMLKLSLCYFGYIRRRHDILEKTRMLGKAEGSRKRGRPNKRWTDSLNLGRAEQGRRGEDLSEMAPSQGHPTLEVT